MHIDFIFFILTEVFSVDFWDSGCSVSKDASLSSSRLHVSFAICEPWEGKSNSWILTFSCQNTNSIDSEFAFNDANNSLINTPEFSLDCSPSLSFIFNKADIEKSLGVWVEICHFESDASNLNLNLN